MAKPKSGKGGSRPKPKGKTTAKPAPKATEKQVAAKAKDAKFEKAENPKAVTGDNILTDDQQRALHFNHRKMYDISLAAKKKAEADFKNACKTIKSEGGSVAEIKLAIQLDSPEGEAAVKGDLETTVKIARWNNSDLGRIQLDFGMDPPAVDRAFEEGKVAGLKALSRKPPHDPSVPQYKRWMEGYDEGQAVLTKKFKPVPPAEAPKGSAPAANGTQKAGDKPPAIKPTDAPPTAPKAPVPPQDGGGVTLQQGGKPH